MNEEYIKEYEEMSLYDFADELVEPLHTVKKDLTKTIYIHYAKERDKIEQLQQENQQLKEQLKATNKGLRKVINKRKKWKARYYKQKHRNKKAIEYINKYNKVNAEKAKTDIDRLAMLINANDLLEILKGTN